MIITVNRADTLELLASEYALPKQKLAADNGLSESNLVVGQSLYIGITERAYIPTQGTNVESVGDEFLQSSKTVFRNNYILKGQSDIPIGTYVVLEYATKPVEEKIIGGYAYDFIRTDRLSSVINYLTYIMPFTYGFTPEGSLISPADGYILEKAAQSGVSSLMHISTLTEEGNFDSNLPSLVFENEEAKGTLIDNIIENVIGKGYDGVDIDFEFLPAEQRSAYTQFTRRLSERLHEIGKILVIAVPPKTSDTQEGLLVEGIDYAGLGENADYVLVMTYEYGYKFGPPLAISPINRVKEALDYAVSRIEREKLLLGIANYGYDWTLPYVRGVSDAPSLSTVEAVALAKKYNAEIMFDDVAKAPFFFYTDGNGFLHEVWFEDARSAAAKTDLIKEYNLAGGFIWDLMRENPQLFVTLNSRIIIV